MIWGRQDDQLAQDHKPLRIGIAELRRALCPRQKHEALDFR
jgi:hypothetical protein